MSPEGRGRRERACPKFAGLFAAIHGVVLEIERGKVRAVVRARPVHVEAQVFGQELLDGFLPHHLKGAHMDAEEFGRDLGVLVGVFAVRHDDEGQALMAVAGRAGFSSRASRLRSLVSMMGLSARTITAFTAASSLQLAMRQVRRSWR